MSRSCHSATFSRPTVALARTTRASPQIRSAVMGFRLCGIADEPFWPRPKGSSTSRTSVRARCRISVAKRSSDDAASASADSTSACRSRCRICVELGAGSSPTRSHAIRSTSGSIAAYWPTAPDSFPTRTPSIARVTRSRSRSSANAHPASLSPNVVGSACTPCVRPMQSVSRCSSARATTTSNARSIPARIPAPASWSMSESAVSRTSDEVRPKWNQRPSSPRVDATASTNAATSWFVSRSSSATRSGDGATAFRWIRSTASAGTTPTLAHPSSAASSTSSMRASRASSDQIRAISGRE